MNLEAANMIAGSPSAEQEVSIHGIDPRTGQQLQPAFPPASLAEVDAAVTAAAEAASVLRRWPVARLAALVEQVAQELEHDAELIVATADRETGLGTPRLEGELARTTGQLRSFSRMARSGWHLDITIDTDAAPETGIRRMQIPIGPVAVFGASNFPLAFGVPGGDTAAALVAGCPVVAKAHPSHPATSQLSGRAISRAAQSSDAPAGTFSLLHGGTDVGQALASAEHIAAVGFTGSYHGGMALFRAAAARPQPIPVYAEMGSLNPAFVYPGAIETRAPELASELAGSITQGGGQFCTKPGLIIVPPDADDFVEMLKGALESLPAQPLLNTSIGELLQRRVQNSLATKVAAPSDESWQARTASCNPLLLELTGDDLLTHRDVLLDEHFGPVSLVVRHEPSHWPELAAQLPGSLSAAINATDDDLDQATELQAALLEKVGRVVWNAVTTGVAVVPSMHHGGPFPATTSPLHSSVGWHAVRRFLRPVAIQGAPTSALPRALLDETMPRLQDSTPAR